MKIEEKEGYDRNLSFRNSEHNAVDSMKLK